MAARKNTWTAQELDILRQLYGTMSAPKLAEYLPNRTVRAIQRMAQVEGLQQKRKPVPTHKRTEEEWAFWRRFVESFLRTHKLATQRGIDIRLSEMFGAFLDAWGTLEGGGACRGKYLKEEN